MLQPMYCHVSELRGLVELNEDPMSNIAANVADATMQPLDHSRARHPS